MHRAGSSPASDREDHRGPQDPGRGEDHQGAQDYTDCCGHGRAAPGAQWGEGVVRAVLHQV
eukprot:15457682-Alexandrium_andersonii.AAC.1